jgi:hypothetical protein
MYSTQGLLLIEICPVVLHSSIDKKSKKKQNVCTKEYQMDRLTKLDLARSGMVE